MKIPLLNFISEIKFDLTGTLKKSNFLFLNASNCNNSACFNGSAITTGIIFFSHPNRVNLMMFSVLTGYSIGKKHSLHQENAKN